MRTKILSILIVGLLASMTGCKDPDNLVPPVARQGLNSFTAFFPNDNRDENKFDAQINHETGEVIVVIPWYYPETSDNVLTTSDITKMIVQAGLDDNVTISPNIHWMDLTKENTITVTNQRKEKKRYTVKGEIRKSNKADILEFSLPDINVSGVVSSENKTVSLISVDPIGGTHLAECKLSLRATISPDPASAALDYSQEREFTVTADDGVTKKTYKVQRVIPPKLPFGMRDGSAKVLWAKKLKDDLGITKMNETNGIAVTKDYVVLNTRAVPSVYIDIKTGDKIGEIDLGPEITGSVKNFYTTADDDGNMFICNLVKNDGNVFKIWKLSAIDATGELFISWDAGGMAAGRKISVRGSVNKNAIITATLYGADANKFAKWRVENGTLVSQTPELIEVKGITAKWGNNCDIIYTSNTDSESDYFLAGYMPSEAGFISGFTWVNGKTNTVRKQLGGMNSNFISNAVDYSIFNGMPYAIFSYANPWNWGDADQVYVVDVASTDDFVTAPNKWGGPSMKDKCIKWASPLGEYGAKKVGTTNGNGTADVVLKVSDNGYYLYAYFMFTNGFVVCCQFDCIDFSEF